MLVFVGQDTLLKTSQCCGTSHPFLSFKRPVSFEHCLLLVDFVQGREELKPPVNV